MESRRPDPRMHPALLGAGLILVAVNLRPAAASLGPVLGRIQTSVHLSSGMAGALTTLPVLCFGLLAPVAPLLARRLGLRGAIAVSMVGLLVGLLLRLGPGAGFLFAGTALAGAAIAVGNVLVPVVVRRDFAARTGTAMALYTTSLIGFAALAAGVTVPAADALGGGWRPGLAVWAAPAALAVLAWSPSLARLGPGRPRSRGARGQSRADEEGRAGPGASAPAATVRRLLGDRLAWQVTLFFALQSGGFYATLAWLPSIFRSHGAGDTEAGLLLSLTMVVGIATALTIPGAAGRLRDQRALAVATTALTSAGFAGLLAAPMAAPYVWAILIGLGQNATFPLALMLIVLRGGSLATTEALSTMSQSVGYVLAALAPLAVGALHGATGTWTPAVILLLALTGPQLVAGLAAGRDRQVDGAPQTGP